MEEKGFAIFTPAGDLIHHSIRDCEEKCKEDYAFTFVSNRWETPEGFGYSCREIKIVIGERKMKNKLKKGLNSTLLEIVKKCNEKIKEQNIRRICKLRFEYKTSELTNEEIVMTYQVFSRKHKDGYIGNELI